MRTLEDHAAAIRGAASTEDAFRAAEAAAQALIGHRLFTVMAFDAARMEVQRRYSSDPEHYPAGGSKKKRDTEWGRHVLEQGRVLIGAGADDIRRYFDDHAVILGLGLTAVLNVPIRRGGETVGTMNLLDATAHYTDADAETGKTLAAALADALDQMGD